jgi:hypothetical protein
MKPEKNSKYMQEILTHSATYLPEGEIKNVQHFLDHNEIGIAFSELCGAIVENEIVISEDLKNRLILMYDHLDGDSEDFLE